MKATVQQIVQCVGAFRKLANADLPLRTAHRLSRVVDAVQKELAFFEAERGKILARHKLTEGLSGSSEDLTRADEEFRALMEMEIDVEAERLELPVGGNISLSANDVGALAPFIAFLEDEYGG